MIVSLQSFAGLCNCCAEMVGFIGTLDLLNFSRPCKPKINPKTGVNTMPKAPASRFKAEVLKMLANGQTAAYIANSTGHSRKHYGSPKKVMITAFSKPQTEFLP